MTPAVPPLEELVGAWIEREALAHLPSLRNQWAQAHVNEDLTSLSWLVAPPYTTGYHTGVLRIDGVPVAAQRLRWSPWGVERSGHHGDIEVHSEARMPLEKAVVLWRIRLKNTSRSLATFTAEQELLGQAALRDVDWGWTYGQPWNFGHHHDYYTMERLRSEVLSAEPRQVQFLAQDARFIRLGQARTPGIQRDEDAAPMLLESELPDHSTPDSGRRRARGIAGRLRDILVSHGEGSSELIGLGEHVLYEPDEEIRLGRVILGEGANLSFDVRLDRGEQNGVILTHGNHPDSLQLGVDEGRLYLQIGGERVVADRVLEPAIWHRISVTISARTCSVHLDGEHAASTHPWWGAQRWQASVRAGGTSGLTIRDTVTPAAAQYHLHTAADRLEAQGSRGLAAWDLTLEPGEQRVIEFALQLTDFDAKEEPAEDFTTAFTATPQDWQELWAAAFTPGNQRFSGYLPTLETQDPDLARTYYLGALLAVYVRNTKVSPIGPVFLTGGPRLGPTATFYWDQSEWARTAALLEPAGMRAWILAALSQDYASSHSFDTRNLLPIGNHYAANDHALFRIVKGYVGITGDISVLFEHAGTRRVIDHLKDFAFRPQSRNAEFGAGILVDFGDDAWELLECVPNYRHAVVSFNAGYVGMLRDYALLARLTGQEGAAQAEAVAERLAQAVLAQYAGDGRWNIAHPDGDETIGHCLDFALVAADMTSDLSPRHKAEMVAFVRNHLIDGDWMRALDPDDPIAALSDRPDHGAAGAFAAWPGATAYGLCRLGETEIALGMLRRAHRATSGALWGQAMEVTRDGSYRVAERGVSNRESNAAVAVTETVIAGLFGITADFSSIQSPHGDLRAGVGELRHVRAVGFDLPRPQLDGFDERLAG